MHEPWSKPSIAKLLGLVQHLPAYLLHRKREDPDFATQSHDDQI